MILLTLPEVGFSAAIDFELFGSAGIGSATISSQSSSKPKSVQYLAGAALGFSPVSVFTIGAITDYRMVTQTSAVGTSWGNRSGKRWNEISPYADISINRLRLRFVYQFSGDYELKNATTAGDSISYGSPKGYRGEAQVCAIRGKERYYKIPGKCFFYMGGFYEMVKFGNEKTGARAAQNLSQPLILKHFGLTMGVGF